MHGSLYTYAYNQGLADHLAYVYNQPRDSLFDLLVFFLFATNCTST